MVTYGASSVGQIKDGCKLEHNVMKRLITGDNMAETPQDGVFRGMTMFAQLTLLEYNGTASATLFWPYGASYLSMSLVGRCDVASSLTAALLLTAVAGTTAAAAPATASLTKAILAEGFPVGLLFAPDLREIPVRLRLYPTLSGAPGSAATFGTLT